jgi:integrase/recombinase XerD
MAERITRMKVPSLRSVLAPTLRALIELRQSLGYGDVAIVSGLAQFDRYLVDRAWDQPILTRRLVDDWMATAAQLKPATQAKRLHVMRLLGRYISQTHADSFVPGSAFARFERSEFRPHIYTRVEIHALLSEAAQLGPTGSLRPKTYVTLIGLLYCAGLRISEALALRLADFDRERGVLWILESKFHKSRATPLRPGSVEGIAPYVEQRAEYGHSAEPDAPLFVNEYGRRCAYPNTVWTFLRVARSSGVRGPAGEKGPRLHDLRHTFAVHRLLEWYRDGSDVQARLPLLADYLGHVSLISTQVYLDVSAELLHEAAHRFRAPTLGARKQEHGVA